MSTEGVLDEYTVLCGFRLPCIFTGKSSSETAPKAARSGENCTSPSLGRKSEEGTPRAMLKYNIEYLDNEELHETLEGCMSSVHRRLDASSASQGRTDYIAEAAWIWASGQVRYH